MIFLPDTNVFSRYLRDRAEDARLLDRLEQSLPDCRLSAIALMELEYGAAKRPEVAAFIKFYLNEGQARVPNVGYISLPTKALDESRQAFEKAAPPATK